MTISHALLAALCNALNVIAQHLGSIASAKESNGWRFVTALLRNPMWLAGWGALAGGFVFQALALHVGQLSVVQPPGWLGSEVAGGGWRGWRHLREAPGLG